MFHLNNNRYNHSFLKKVLSLSLLFIVLLPIWAYAGNTEPPVMPVKEIRDDGLTIITSPSPDKEHPEIQYLNLILKTGYANDPIGKSGLTGLTNEILLYGNFKRTNALYVNCQTYPEFTIFYFVTTRSAFKEFCNQLDQIIRAEALLFYDLCNVLIQDHLTVPKPPEKEAEVALYSLIYGSGHPYSSVFAPNYDKLDINEVNKWFRQVYKPNNIIIATSLKLPEEFLRRPSGRDFAEPVNLDKIPAFGAASLPVLKFTPVRDNKATICLGIQAPKFNEEGVFATLLIKKYLEKKLWRVIREDNGLSYDLGVFYSVISEPSAPMLEIVLHTLAPDTGAVISTIIGELKKVAMEGIPKEETAKILERERKRLLVNEKDPETAVKSAGLYGIFDQKWLFDNNEYLTRLEEESKIVAKTMTTGLAHLKISVAGPKETDQYLKDALGDLNPAEK